MGQLGAIQLYLKLLQSDSLEEQSLGTAGIWILAFCDENRHLINNVQGCTQGEKKMREFWSIGWISLCHLETSC